MDILILLIIFILTIFICRNNVKKRIEELKTNLETFNKDIKNHFMSMSTSQQEELLNTLSPQHRSDLENVLNDNFNYANNHWAIQQQIFQQQELFIKLNAIDRK